MVHFRVWLQLAEALGSDNQWYCSQAYGCCVTDHEALIKYFVRSGGATDFARRFDEAMGPLNRWYCSEHYGYEVRDPQVLWNYYMGFRARRLRSLAC